MIPIINIIGRSNTGKTTLFNKLINSKNNIIGNYYNLTKERNYGLGFFGVFNYFLIDTPGFAFKDDNIYNVLININLSIEESDIILFLLDINEISYLDIKLSNLLKKKKKYIFLIINKIDLKKNLNFDFSFINKLGLGKPYFLSLIKNFNINNLINNILNIFCYNKICIKKKYIKKKVKISIIGKPNIGKSTLINSLLKKNRLISFNKPNVTFDLNFINFKYKNYNFLLIDTYGLNFKKNNIKNINNICFIKTLQIIIISNIVIFLTSFEEKFYNIDISIFKFLKNEFISFIILINKSDLFDIIYKIFFKIYLKKKINIYNFYILNISALKCKNLNYIKIYLEKIFLLSIIKISTKKLNFLLKKINNFFKINNRFKKIKLNFIHQGGKNPPLIIVYSNNKKYINKYFKNFLIKIFYKELFLKSIFIKIKLK